MVRRHGSLIQPHYPRRNQYGPVWQGCIAALMKLILESAVRIGQLIGLGIDLTLGIYSDGSDLLLSYGTVAHTGLGVCDGIHHIQTCRLTTGGRNQNLP